MFNSPTLDGLRIVGYMQYGGNAKQARGCSEFSADRSRITDRTETRRTDMFRKALHKRFCLLIVALVTSSCALAQYSGGGMGTSPTSGGTYSPSSRSYGHGAAIGAGIGAGA